MDTIELLYANDINREWLYKFILGRAAFFPQ